MIECSVIAYSGRCGNPAVTRDPAGSKGSMGSVGLYPDYFYCAEHTEEIRERRRNRERFKQEAEALPLLFPEDEK